MRWFCDPWTEATREEVSCALPLRHFLRLLERNVSLLGIREAKKKKFKVRFKIKLGF
jgi:hypothetical protein